jgi:hypothetical protein
MASQADFGIELCGEWKRVTVTISLCCLEGWNDLRWIEPAGYTVAWSRRPKSGPSVLSNYNFDSDVRESRFLQLPYLLYR